MTKSTKWDYCFLDVTEDGFYCSSEGYSPPDMEPGSPEWGLAGGQPAIWRDLIELGEAGWELVAVWWDAKRQQAVGAFKRPIEE